MTRVQLKNPAELERSPVVANSTMNRERELTGTNSYSKDLAIDFTAYLESRLGERGEVSWLDLCCGTGRALIQAAEQLSGHAGRLTIVGVDLVAMFMPAPRELDALQLIEANLESWEPAARFDLVTCVHGLHYVGDKLGLIARALTWLKDDGLFKANLDLANLRLATGKRAARRVLSAFRDAGLAYHSRKRILTAQGTRAVELPFVYLGADDGAGPNATGQPAVSSHYRAV